MAGKSVGKSIGKVTEIKIFMKINEDVKRDIEAGAAVAAARSFETSKDVSKWIIRVLSKAIAEGITPDFEKYPMLEEKRNAVLDFRCSEEFREACKKAAGKTGRTTSTWIQALLLRELAIQ